MRDAVRPGALISAIDVAGLAALAALTAMSFSGASPICVGGWTALAVGLATLRGPRLGAAIAVAAVTLSWALPVHGGAFTWDASTSNLLAVAATTMVAATWGAGWARRRARQALSGERRTRLLVDAALELGDVHDARGILVALPPLVSRVLAARHVSVLHVADGALLVAAMVPPLLEAGTRILEPSIVGRAARTGVTQLVPDARVDPEHRAVGDLPSDVTEMAVPLRVAGRTCAVLNVERSVADAFDDADRAALEALARIAEAHLGRLATLEEAERQQREAGLLADVARRLASADDARRAAHLAVDALVTATGTSAGSVFLVERGLFRSIALSGEVPAAVASLLDGGIAWGRGRLYQAWQAGETVLDADFAKSSPDSEYRALGLRAAAIVPVRDTDGETIALIVLASLSAPRRWTAGDRQLLEGVASTLGAVLARATLRQRETELLEVVRQMARSDDAAELYQRVVEAAVRVVPGAEASTLLVGRHGTGFRFEGAVGYDLAALRTAGALSEAQQLSWYGRSASDFRAGRPRVLAGEDVARTSANASDETARAVLLGPGMTQQIRATLCVPVAYQGEVLAILNVDAFTREDAFGQRSTTLAEALGQHVAVIVRQAHDRAALARSALTDPLTGLGNREAFNRSLARELQRAKRHGEPVAVAMLDLDGFKEVNDRFGHQAGDRALAEVARALLGAVRASDGVYRWGGDEFAVVMPMLAPGAGQAAADRCLQAIATLDVNGVALRASVGLANYPEDGSDAETLLRRADDLMYAIKGARTRHAP